DWRKNYRIWEANRKVFLWPENYIEPGLRDDKSPLFKKVESTLLEQQITEQNVLDAYGDYLSGFEEVTRLKLAGAYHDKNRQSETDILHVFGVSSDTPPAYYYRTVENAHFSEIATKTPRGIVYSAWRKIEVQIPVERITPVIHVGR